MSMQLMLVCVLIAWNVNYPNERIFDIMKTHQTKIVVIKWKITQMLSQYFINLHLTRSQFDVNHFWSFVNKCENYKRLRVEFPTNQLDVVFGVWSLRVSLRSPDGFASLLWTVSKKDFNVLFRTKSVFRIVCFLSVLRSRHWMASVEIPAERRRITICEQWSKNCGAKWTWVWCVENIAKCFTLRFHAFQ